MAAPDAVPAGRRGLARTLGWLALANGLLAALIGLRTLALYDVPMAFLPLVYTGLAYLAHYATLGLLALLPAFLLTLLWPRWLPVRAVAAVAGALLLAALVVDGNVFAEQRYHLTPLTVAIFAPATWVFAVVIGATALVFQWLLTGLAAGFVLARPQRGGTVVCAVLVVGWLVGQGLHMYADAQGDTRFTALTRYLPAYFPLKGKRTLARLGLVDPAVAERQRLLARADAGGGGQLRYPLVPLRCPAPARTGQPPNLLFVLIDALRPDAIDPRLTPNLAALRFEGQAFMNHWSGGNSSRAGLFAFFYGLPSTYLDAFYGVQQPPVLLTALRDRNYQLALFAAPGFGSPTDLDRTSFAGVPGLPGEAPDLSATARNQRVTQQWQDWLRRERDPARPFLAFLYYDPPMGDMAGDADPALPLGERFPPRADRKPDAPAQWARYRRAARFADAEFGAVDAALGAAGLAGDTLLVVFSDHGYEFDDYGNGYLGHASDFSDAQLRATLLLRWPGRPARRFAHRTSHFDVVPTLLGDWLGCTSPPADYATGRSLFAGVDWQWLIAGSYNAEAIVEPRRRTVTQPGGFVELRDNEYHPYAGPAPDPAVIEAALADQRRFYR